MTQTINIDFIVTMMKILPKQYDTKTIKIARGKYKLPINLGGLLKKLNHG